MLNFTYAILEAREVAVFSEKCGGFKIKINNCDHEPPHCHVNISGRNTSIDLMTLEILNPPPHRVPPGLKKCLEKHQAAMLVAWESVTVSRMQASGDDGGAE
jgi:hypothetical protein